MPNSIALLLTEGRLPGIPEQAGHTFSFGPAPNLAEQEQNSFDSVASSTWTSSPITISYFMLDILHRRRDQLDPSNRHRRQPAQNGNVAFGGVFLHLCFGKV
jgi:hypothetical protein